MELEVELKTVAGGGGGSLRGGTASPLVVVVVIGEVVEVVGTGSLFQVGPESVACC